MVTRYPGSLGIKIEVQVANENALSVTFPSVLLFVILGFFVVGLNGLGYSTTIAASYGSVEQVCAIEANGEQEVLCWGSNSSGVDYPSSTQLAFSVLSGGNGFMCGLMPESYTPYCWEGNWTGSNLIPQQYQNNSYATIATGETHFCAITGDKKGDVDGDGGGIVQCWGENEAGQVDVPPDLPTMDSIVAGRSYTCALEKYSRRPRCWGSSQYGIESSIPDAAFESLSAGTNHVCGVVQYNKLVQCWGDNSFGQSNPLQNVSFIAVSTGLTHSCGITELSHEVQCWGDQSFDMSTVHTGFGFLALTSAPNMTCGIREDNLLAMCWGNEAAKTNYSPPLQLFSPGLCSPNPCGSDFFTFHPSNVLDVGASRTGNICLDSNSQICAPCASSCPSGSFLSSACGADVDRVCTDCSLCQNDSCQASCVGVSSFPAASPLQGKSSSSGRKSNTAPIIGAAVTGGVLVLVLGALFICFLYRKRFRYRFWGCASRQKLTDSGGGISSGSLPGGSHILTGGGRNGIINGGVRNGNHVVTHDIIRMQAFRLAELRDATNGFKEVNELGRGSYGFVYKALLPDGRQVAVKRANAARRIQSRSRDFEAELEVLCKLHHAHLVNLVGYCEEMGERLLVYEFMPHGTLHDHLHGGLAQLNWHLRLKIAAQAARGIEYLHKDASPRIIHRDVKSSNILLDAEWGARVADFGLALPEREKGPPPSMRPCDVAYVDPEYLRTQTYTEKSDVYSFGVVLLEILCGRKAWDSDFKPANIVEWATPFIRNGQSSQILDRSLDLPKNKEPLMRVGEIVELCVRSSPQERPSMTDVASWLELVGRSSSL